MDMTRAGSVPCFVNDLAASWRCLRAIPTDAREDDRLNAVPPHLNAFVIAPVEGLARPDGLRGIGCCSDCHQLSTGGPDVEPCPGSLDQRDIGAVRRVENPKGKTAAAAAVLTAEAPLHRIVNRVDDAVPPAAHDVETLELWVILRAPNVRRRGPVRTPGEQPGPTSRDDSLWRAAQGHTQQASVGGCRGQLTCVNRLRRVVHLITQ